MDKSTPFEQAFQANEVLAKSVVHSLPRSRGIARACLKVAGAAGRIRSATDHSTVALESKVQKHVQPAEKSDNALIKAIARGDRHAMTLLYRRHHLRVYHFVLRITGNRTLAEDIVSEVFIDIWRNADGFKALAQVSTWLLGIARNKSLSAVRQCSGQQVDCETIEISDAAEDPEMSAHKSDRSRGIRRCLSQLPAVQREVHDLVYYHEKTVAEVAEIVGVPASTVRTRMFYARQRMGELLKAAGHEGI
jgi:RNA polymerase sigma-70 factor (ECF subfamily)